MNDTSIPGVSFHAFGEGKLGPLVQAKDWSKTSLGPIENWPDVLKIHVSLMLALPTPAIIFWGEDQVQIYNDGYAVIMGPRHPKHLGSTFQECWPEAFPVIDTWMKRVTKNAEVVVVDKSMIPLTRHGYIEECYFSFTFSPLRDAEGKIGGLLQIVTEVTESILSNRRLETLQKISLPVNSQSERFKSVIQLLSLNPSDIRFALLFLPNGQASQFNLVGSFGASEQIAETPGFNQLMMQINEAFVSGNAQEIKHIQNLMPHIPIEPWQELTQMAMALPIRAATLDSPQGVVVFGISPRLKFDEKYRGFFIDVVRAIGAVLQENLNFELDKFFNLSIDMFCIAGLDGYFRRVNPAFEKTLGYSPQELQSRPFLDFVHPDDKETTLAEMGKLATGAPTLYFENRYLCKNGTYKWIAWKSVPVLSDSILYAVARDITEKKLAEEQHSLILKEQLARVEAEKLVQQREDFIAIAAHELKTPLTAISLQAQLINKFLPTIEAPNIQKYIGMSNNYKEQIERLTKLVDNLLDVSRASSGRLIITKTEINLSEAVRQIASSLEAEFIKSKCKLVLHLDSSIVGLWELARIEQILVNLMSNAIKFGAGKPVEISTKIAGAMAVIVVQDQGIGISKEDHARVFNRFERAVSVKSFGGLGLGLYITQQIVTAHGGNIRVESELGKGSSFIVELPLK